MIRTIVFIVTTSVNIVKVSNMRLRFALWGILMMVMGSLAMEMTDRRSTMP